MNKIEVEENKINSNFSLLINDSFIVLEDVDVAIFYKNTTSSYKFKIKSNVKIFEYYINSSCNNTYNLDSNTNLIINRFSYDCSIKSDINLSYKSDLLYKYSCVNKSNNNYCINIYHNEPYATSKVINYGINFTDKKLDFLINSYIKKESVNSKAIQDSKIIIKKESNCSIKPNLIIDNNEIDSSHSAYIGFFKESEIFYLQSRGIDYDTASKLLAKSFLISKMDVEEELINLIIDDLNKMWGCIIYE